MPDAVEYPGLKFRVLGGQQVREQGLFGRVRGVELIVEIALHDEVEFQHATPALPAQPLQFPGMRLSQALQGGQCQLQLSMLNLQLGLAQTDGQFRLGLGVFLIAADAVLVTLYVGSCHSFRHLVGGSMDCFSCTAYTETRHGIWKWVSRINVHHGKYAWLSLFSIILVDLYVRALALDIINTSTPVIGGFL